MKPKLFPMLAAAAALTAGASARAPRGPAPVPKVAPPVIQADTIRTVTRVLSSAADSCYASLAAKKEVTS